MSSVDKAEAAIEKVGNYVSVETFIDNVASAGWVFGLVLTLELWIIGYSRSSIRRLFARDGQSSRVDLFATVVYLSGGALFLGLCMTAGFTSFMTSMLAVVFPAPPLDGLPDLLKALAVIISGDFFYYWLHRLFHVFPPFWAVHRFHHSAEEFSVFTSVRTHPIEIAFDVLVTAAVPIALFGAPGGAAAALFIGIRLISTLHHSKFESDWGWVGRWVFVSPRTHLIHHSRDVAHFNRNFGFISPLWDRMFGTYSTDISSDISIGAQVPERFSRSWIAGVAEATGGFFWYLLPRFLRSRLPHWVSYHLAQDLPAASTRSHSSAS